MTNKMNKFSIADLEFAPDFAQLIADIRNGRIEWSISISAEPRVIRGEQWQPRASSDHLVALDSRFLEYWQDAFAKSVEWDDCCNPINDRVHALLYVFEHTEIYKSRIDFVPRKGRDVFVNWHALCDVFFDEEYESRLNLCIQTAATFNGVVVGTAGERIDEIEANIRLRRFIAHGEFEYLPPIGDSYVPIMMPTART
jgi:hypothetical protein